VAGTVTRDGGGWVTYLLEVPPGLSPIITVGRFATVEEAQVARCGRPAAHHEAAAYRDRLSPTARVPDPVCG